MEELESLLASVKAWASKLLEALGLCRKDRDGLAIENAELRKVAAEKQAEIDRILQVGPPPVGVPAPEPPPIDLGPILAIIGEFKVAIESVQSKLDSLSAKVNDLLSMSPETSAARLAAIETVNEEIRNKLRALLNRPEQPDLSSFVNKVTVDLDYFRQKLNRLPI